MRAQDKAEDCQDLKQQTRYVLQQRHCQMPRAEGGEDIYVSIPEKNKMLIELT